MLPMRVCRADLSGNFVESKKTRLYLSDFRQKGVLIGTDLVGTQFQQYRPARTTCVDCCVDTGLAQESLYQDEVLSDILFVMIRSFYLVICHSVWTLQSLDFALLGYLTGGSSGGFVEQGSDKLSFMCVYSQLSFLVTLEDVFFRR